MGGVGKREAIPLAWILMGGIALTLVGLLLPWISGGVGGTSGVSRGLDLPAVWVPTMLSILAVTILGFRWQSSGDEKFAAYAALAAGFLLFFLLVTLLGIELFSDLTPSSILPASVRRSSALLTAGPGIWTSLAGVILVLLATGGRRVRTAVTRSAEGSGGRRKLLLALLVAPLALAIGWLRYQPWISVTVLGEEVTLIGQAAPWIGPASLLGIALLVGSLVLAALAQFQAAGLVAAAAGWFLSFLSAIAVIGGETLARLRFGALLGGNLTSHSVTFRPGVAAWLTYVCALMIALVGGFLVWSSYRPGGG